MLEKYMFEGSDLISEEFIPVYIKDYGQAAFLE
jgi:uncharacterized protein YqkB